MDIHATTVTMPEIDIHHKYTVSAAMTLVSSEQPEIPIVISRALIGTPFWSVSLKEPGPFCLLKATTSYARLHINQNWQQIKSPLI